MPAQSWRGAEGEKIRISTYQCSRCTAWRHTLPVETRLWRPPLPSNFCNFIMLDCPTRFYLHGSSPMMRHIVLSAALSLLPCLAQAQDQPISVYFEPLKGNNLTTLNDAITA